MTAVRRTSRWRGLGRILVIVPTYNERENIIPILERLRWSVPEADALIVDDASPDGTGTLADGIGAGDPAVAVLHREAKAGLGAAYLAGFDWAGRHGYDVVVEMDADGSHAPEELPLLLTALTDADLVLGSRWVAGGAVLDWPRRRVALSRGGNAYVRWALGLPVRDATGGFRAYRRQVLDEVGMADVASHGYCFQVDLAWRIWRAGYRVVEVPITFVERTRGASKMDRHIVVEALWRVTWWGLTNIHRRRPAVVRAGSGPHSSRRHEWTGERS